MQFIKDFGKLLAVIFSIVLLCFLFGWLVGAKSGADRTEYYLNEHEIADDMNVQDNAPWNQKENDSLD